MTMPKQLTIATWNIAGARKMASLDMFDYEAENIEYFVDALAKLSPDIVCLQESHTNDTTVIAHDMARQLGMEYAYNTPVSASHIDEKYQLGNAVLSKIPLESLGDVKYPYPAFGHTLVNGRPAQRHDKLVSIFEFRGLMIANTQMLPLGIFGEAYNRGEGVQLAQQIQSGLLEHLRTPLILCGDINFDNPAVLYPDLYARLGLREALPDVMTRPNKQNLKKTPDHIIISENITLVRSGVVPVVADHYLCWAELELPASLL